MGQLGSGLTNPGTALMSSASGGEPIFIGTPSQVQQHLNQSRDSVIKSGANNPVMNPKPQPAFPTQGDPTFQQAATAGATPGGANALSPGLNKAGKLMTLLTSGLQGALAGRAASEQTVAATGGRRSGGAGMGFEAGYELPWQRASKQLGLEQQQAQVELTKAQGQMVPTQYGPMPAALARYILPAQIRGEATENAAQTAAGGRVQAAQIGQKFKAVPGVGLFDTTTRQVVPGTANGVTITPEIAQDYQLPQDFIGKPMNVAQLASLERASNSNLTTVQGAQGPALVNKQKGTAKTLGLGSPAVAGAQARAANTPFETVIPGTNTPTTISNAEALKTGAPKVPLGTQMKLGGQYAVFNDAYGLLNKIEGDGSKVNLNDPAVRTRLMAGYAALSEPASKGLVGQIAGYLARSGVTSQLKPEERQLLIHMGQLKAAATGLRSITGQAGANEFQQRLDAALAAGPGQATSLAALKQHTAGMRDFLQRFQVGQPNVGLNAPNQPSNLQNSTQAPPDPFKVFGGTAHP